MPDLSLPKDFSDLVEAKRPAQASDRHRVCAVCGQTFDSVHLDEVFHHDDRPHQPLTPNAV